MGVLYDLWAAQPLQGSYHGGGTHALAIAERLAALNQRRSITAFYDATRWIDPEAVALLEARDIPLADVRNKTELQALIDTRKFDRLYSSLPYDLYDLDLTSVDFMMTIHGLRQLEVPADTYEFVYADGWRRRIKSGLRRLGVPLYRGRQWKRLERLIHINAHDTLIIAPSTHTKHALLNAFPSLSPNAVRVSFSPLRRCPDPIEAETEGETILRDVGVTSRHYFLMVNAGRWVKNAYRALRALDAFFATHPEVEHKVVLLGVEKGQRLTRGLHNTDRFIFRDYVSAATLQVLYREAFVLLYPTLNEGFGYPPLEAMRWGTPVICSAVTSLPEVCNSAALYCNPYRIDEIQNRVSQLVLEPGLWDHYARCGRERFHEMERLQRESLDRLCGFILNGWETNSTVVPQ